MTGQESLLVSVAEAARITGVGRDMAYRLVREGAWPAVRLGRLIKIPRTALFAWTEGIATKCLGEPATDLGSPGAPA